MTIINPLHDPCGAFLLTQVEQQFSEHFPRTVPPPGLTVASERPAPVVHSPPVPSGGRRLQFFPQPERSLTLMKFAFDLCQRVNAPGSDGRIQGIIVGASAAIGMENQYVVSVLTDEGRSGSVGYGEAVLLAAQKATFAKAK